MTHNPYAPPNAKLDDHDAVISETAAMSLSRYDYGGFWVRVLATIIDTIILLPPQFALEYFLKGSIGADLVTVSDYALQMAITSSVWCVYCTACWSSPWQATPGKLACGLRVTTVELTRLSVLHAFGRYWAYSISSLIVIGVFFIPFTEKRQALHDLMAKTVVPKRDAIRRAGR